MHAIENKNHPCLGPTLEAFAEEQAAKAERLEAALKAEVICGACDGSGISKVLGLRWGDIDTGKREDKCYECDGSGRMIKSDLARSILKENADAN